MVAQFLTRVRRSLDRGLHPGRRARARTRVLEWGPIHGLLVVCQGNICRSPFAGAKLTPPPLRAAAAPPPRAGAGGGAPPPAPRAPPPRRFGVDLAPHRSHLVVPSLLGSSDMILVMDSGQRATLRYDFGFPGDRIL